MSLYRENPDIDVIIVADAKDKKTKEIAWEYNAFYVPRPSEDTAPWAWYAGLQAKPDYDAYILGADDIEFLPGWWKATESALAKINNSGVVGFTDGWKPAELEGWATDYLATRDFIVQYGGGVLYPPCYRHYCGDPEYCKRAGKVNKYIWAKDAHIFHEAVSGRRESEGDLDWHKNINLNDVLRRDIRLATRRERLGWPNIWEPAIK
jgi:hypothetical protein